MKLKKKLGAQREKDLEDGVETSPGGGPTRARQRQEKTCRQRQEFRKKERKRQEMGEIERERKPGEAACGLKILKQIKSQRLGMHFWWRSSF